MKIEWLFIWIDLILFTQICFVQNYVEIGTVVLAKKIFLKLSIYFFYLFIYFPILPFGKCVALIWTIMNPPQSGILCAKFSGSGEEDFFKKLSIFFYLFIYFPIIPF